MAVRLPFSSSQYWDATNKEPYAGAKMFTYAAGTTTDKDTYTTSTEAVARANPVIADANGIFPEIYGSGNYNIVIKNSAESVTIYEADNIAASGITPAFSTKITATGTYTTPTNATMLKVTTIGGGAGGGGADEATTNCAGGGGSGATSIVYLSGTLDSSYDATIGAGGAGAADNTSNQGTAGGDTDFARTSGNGGTTLCLAKGGSGGQTYISGQGGAASGGTGDIKIDGFSGHSGAGAYSGAGAGSYPGGNGGGAGGGRTGSGGDEDAETNSGAGGAGGSQDTTGPVVYQSSGAGGAGYILVEYWV